MTREEIIARFRKDAADELISDEYRVLLTHAAKLLEADTSMHKYSSYMVTTLTAKDRDEMLRAVPEVDQRNDT